MGLRSPKLYFDQKCRVQRADGSVLETTGVGLFDYAFRNPHNCGLRWMMHRTIGDTITEITGFDAIHAKDVDALCDRHRWWSLPLHGASTRDVLACLTPAYRSSYSRWYYLRDVFAVLMPRLRCGACGKKLGARWEDRYKEDGVWHWLTEAKVWDRVEKEYVRERDCCTSVCRRIEKRLWNKLYGRRIRREEHRIWWEHLKVPVCSPTCHGVVARRYGREVLNLAEKRLWVIQGTQSLNAVKDLLPNGQSRGRRASKSRTVASIPLATSAT